MTSARNQSKRRKSASSKRTCPTKSAFLPTSASSVWKHSGGKEVAGRPARRGTNKRLLNKGNVLDRDAIERISTRNLKRIKYADKDPRVNEQIDEIEEMTSRQIDVLKKIVTRRRKNSPRETNCRRA